MRTETKDLIVGLDIGTSKVVVAVAEALPDGRLQVIGLGQAASQGLRRGVVVNIESTVQAIKAAIEEAELMAACQIKEAFTGIAGSHIKSFNSSGMVAIKDREVAASDVARVIETAKAINIPTDQQVLHVLTQEFIVDGQEDIREPIGMRWGAARSARAYRDRRGQRSTEHHQKRAPLRAGGAGPDLAAARVVAFRADRGRKELGVRAGRCRRHR
jgi:cell division ATPase FtsA